MVIDLTNECHKILEMHPDTSAIECLVFIALLIRQVHNDRISVLRVTERTIISASYDRTVKLWDRNTKKQVQHIPGQIHTHTHSQTHTTE